MSAMSPIKNIAASILAATRISDGHATKLSLPDAHREPSIGLTPGPVDTGPPEGERTQSMPSGDRLAYLADVVELQRAELTRLLQENRRLNERVDQMVKLQEREQVLRQQMHATLERLSDNRMSLAASRQQDRIDDHHAESERKYLALKQSVAHLVTYIQRLDPGAGSR